MICNYSIYNKRKKKHWTFSFVDSKGNPAMYSTLSTCLFIHGFGQKLFLQLQYKQKLFSQSDPFESGKREIEKRNVFTIYQLFTVLFFLVLLRECIFHWQVEKWDSCPTAPSILHATSSNFPVICNWVKIKMLSQLNIKPSHMHILNLRSEN